MSNDQAAAYAAMAQNGGYQMSASNMVFEVALRAAFDFIQRVISSPVDRVMTLTTVEGELVQQGRLPRLGFGGIFACVKRIWKKEGAAGFFRGVATDAVLAMPSSFVDAFSTNFVFACLQVVMPESLSQKMNMPAIIALSLVASGAAVVVATPYNGLRKTIVTNYIGDIVAPLSGFAAAADDDVEKEKKKGEEETSPASPMQEGYRYASATDAAQSIKRRGGWSAFYRGAAVEPITVAAYRALYMFASAIITSEYQMYHPYAVARGLAIVADVVTQPLEVISRRLVLSASADEPEYDGMIDCARKIVGREGVTALWAGLRFRLLVSALSIGVRIAYVAAFGEDQ